MHVVFVLLWLLIGVLPVRSAERQAKSSERSLHYFAQRGGQVTIQGGHKPFDWEVQGRVIEGRFECEPGFPVKRGQVVKTGRMQGLMEGYIPLRSLHSCYGSLMDEFMYSEMNETNAAHIFFRFNNLVLTNLPSGKNASYQFETRAELVVAGITNRMLMPVSVRPLPGDKLQIRGNTHIPLANLGIESSRTVSLFVKNGDQIKLSFEWLLGPKPFKQNKTRW